MVYKSVDLSSQSSNRSGPFSDSEDPSLVDHLPQKNVMFHDDFGSFLLFFFEGRESWVFV